MTGIAPVAAYGLGLASALLLFASILAHELGHAVVARRHGIAVEEIDLWLLGGVAKMQGQPRHPGDELRFAAAGPAVTAAIAAVFGALVLVLPSSAPEALRALLTYQLEINAIILAFNLIPAFPLDGGRVARALLWRRSGDLNRATSVAATLGRGFGRVLIALGLVGVVFGQPAGLWFALIGFFLSMAAGAERRQQQIESTFSGVTVGELMSRPAVSVPAELTLDEAARAYFAPHRYSAFPVVDRTGRAIGVLTIERLMAMAPAERAVILAGRAADRDAALLIDEPADVAVLLQRPAFGRVGRAVVVDRSGRPVGIVSMTDVQRAMRAAKLDIAKSA